MSLFCTSSPKPDQHQCININYMLKKENALTETVYTFFIQKLYKMYPTDVYKMHTKCIYTIFRQAFVYILWTKSKELCQLNFVYKMYTKVCQNVVYILYTKIFYTFYIHFAYKMYSLLKCEIHFVYILYASILIYLKHTS